MDTDIQYYILYLAVFLNHLKKKFLRILLQSAKQQISKKGKTRFIFFFFSYSIIFLQHFFNPSEIFAQLSKQALNAMLRPKHKLRI